MQHDPVAQFESEVDALGRIRRVAIRQDAGVYKAGPSRRKRGTGIARGVGQLRSPARVARFGDPFSLAKGNDGKSAGRPPFKNLSPFLRAAPMVRTAENRCFCHARFSSSLKTGALFGNVAGERRTPVG